jgi:hypothetical protein
VNPADGRYVPSPDTATESTTCPPESHDVGALADGPNTLKITVPPGADPPNSTADTADPGIAAPAVPDDGTLNDNDVEGSAALMTVSGIPAPHAECDPPLPASPL